MADLTPSAEGRVLPWVETALQRSALRVALVHAPSSENQARELMEMLALKGVHDCIIVNVSSVSGIFLCTRAIIVIVITTTTTTTIIIIITTPPP
jgi:hypothetical protein